MLSWKAISVLSCFFPFHLLNQICYLKVCVKYQLPSQHLSRFSLLCCFFVVAFVFSGRWIIAACDLRPVMHCLQELQTLFMENYSLYFWWVSDAACPNLIWSKRFCCKLLFLVHFVFLFCAYRSIELRVKYPPSSWKREKCYSCHEW